MWKWLAAIIILMILSVTGILLEKPKGSLAGTISLQKSISESGKSVYNTDNILKNNARVVAYGPVVRGSYVNSKGVYKIDGLPIGEYRVQVIANSYSSSTIWSAKVEESKVNNLDNVNLSFLTPSLSLASDIKVFTTKESPYFWFKTSAVDNVELKLYKLDLEESIQSKAKDSNDLKTYINFLLGNYYYGSKDFLKTLIQNKTPLQTWEKDVIYSSEDYSSTPFKIKDKLSAGAYLLVADGKSDLDNAKYSDAYWFAVSKLGIITKQAPNKLLVRTLNLETLEPMENVNLKLYDKEDKLKLLNEIKTNQDGMAELTYKEEDTEKYSSLFILGNKEDSSAINSSYVWYYTEDKYKVYLYTERPVYRPDQTVYFKGIVRKIDEDGFKNVPNQDVKVTINNPDQETQKTINLTTNKYGSFSGLLELSKDAKLGNYEIITTIKSNDYYDYFEVAEYRKPEYKVEVMPGSKVLVGGETANATVKATYFFGYPVTNAKVKYTVYASPDYDLKWRLIPRPDYYSFYDDWEDNEFDFPADEYGSSSGEIIAEGYATTDDNGEAKITFKTNKVEVQSESFYSYEESMPQKYKVEAEVTDISRKTSVGTGNFDVVSGDYALFVDPESYVYTHDQDISVNVQSIDYNKKPVVAKVTLQLQRWEWDEENWSYSNPKVISESAVTTDKDGEGRAILKIPENTPTMNFRIVAISEDQNGNKVTATSYVWISNFRYAGIKAEVKPKIQVTLDKKVYQPGDTAKIMVVSPVKDVQALVCVEGSKLYSYQLVNITSNTQLIEIPIEEKYVPNAYVSVTIVGPNKQYNEQTKMVKVSPNNNFLNLDIQADRSKYKPQDIVNYTIKVTDKYGSPVKAELSVGVVDESLYAVREDFTADIRKFFFGRRSNLVQTAYSFYRSYSAGGDKIQPHLRKDFKDTAYWKAHVTTNEKGIAKVTFKVPDNLTTWRTTVRAITQDTKVAAERSSILVTKDIIVRLALPRFYTVGDKPVLATIVHNYTDKPQDIKIKLNLSSNFVVDGGIKNNELFLKIPAQGKERKDWNLEVKAAGKTKVQAYALSSTIEGDAIENEIEILPFGIPKNALQVGKLTEDAASKTLEENITEKVVPGSLKWNVRIAPTNASTILGSLDYLIDYPYGCTEQTMSKFLPSIIAADISNNLGVSLSEKSQKKLPAVVQDSLDRLYKFQHDDGGWGWWIYDESKPYMTAYVLYGLKYAMMNNYKIDKDRVNRALAWLEKHLATAEVKNIMDKAFIADKVGNVYGLETVEELCYESYILSLYGKRNDKVLDQLYQNRSKMQSQGLAYLALAYAELGNNQNAAELVSNLINRVDIASPIIGFSILKNLGINYNYNDPEITSIVLRAMVKVTPDNPIIPKMVEYLMANRSGDYWYNTKTTSSVVLALAEHLKASLVTENPDYDVVVKLNGKKIDQLHFDRSNMFAEESVIKIPNNLISETNKITLEKTGPGKMYYSSEFGYYQLFGTDEVIPAVSDNGIKVTKDFYSLMSKTDVDGNITYKEVPLTRAVKPGEVLLVKLTVENSKPGDYMVLEDPKASGMELISADPRSKLGANYDSESDADFYWWDYWWSQQEDRDTHVAFFVTHLPAGKHEIKYLLRPELPGSYMIRPTSVEGMYSTILRGSTASFKIDVSE